MHVVITGAKGFIGRHVALRLSELGSFTVSGVTRESSSESRAHALASADAVVHLAGVNRPPDPSKFSAGNVGSTADLCAELRDLGRPVPVIYSSSAQAALDNPYGRSKLGAEQVLMQHSRDTGAPVAYFRFGNVFGKWARPNYNSAIATFCHNIARGLPITVNDPSAPLRLLYIDDVVNAIVALLRDGVSTSGEYSAGPVYETTVGSVAEQIRSFSAGRQTRAFGAVGVGLTRALYATYVSYILPESFSYSLVRHEDSRGCFAEVLRTPDAGQFSFFTAHPGVTRGGHYHHTKTEKFLVLRGTARFGFRHVVTGEQQQLVVTGADSRVVDTIPGWSHDITNIGLDELIVMLWANEAFDPSRPDTIAASVTA